MSSQDKTYLSGWGYLPSYSSVGYTPKRHYIDAGTCVTLCRLWETIGPQWVADDGEGEVTDDDPDNCKRCLRVLRRRVA